MVPSPKLLFIANGNNPTGVGLALSSTKHFSSLELITDCLGHLSLSPQEWDSGTIFIGMVHSGSPSLRTTLRGSMRTVPPLAPRGAWDPLAPEGAT
jgi:hypothetical protein